MNCENVYLVTAGEHSDYGVLRVCKTLEAAEKYAATHARGFGYDRPNIEVYDFDDGSTIQLDIVYRYISFSYWERNQIDTMIWNMRYETEPLKDQELGIRSTDYDRLDGMLSVVKFYDIENEEDCRHVEKMIRDAVAKFKTEKEGLI